VSIIDEIAEALRSFPPVPRYELYCHPSVYYAIQRSGLAMSQYSPMPLNPLYGADIVVAPELGEGVWELYGNKKLIDYGRFRERTEA